MKVLHLISGGDTGGAKTHVLSLVKELQKHVDISLVCLMEGEFYREGLEMGLNISVIRQGSRYNLGAVKKIKRMIKKDGYDIFHCHGARANFLATMVKLGLKVPVVTTMHSDYKLDFQGNFYKDLVFTTLNSWSLRYLDNYIAVSDNFKKMLISRGFQEDNIYVVYNGIDFEREKELKLCGREEFFRRFQLDIPQNAKIVGTVGRLHPVKGHELFLQGAKLVLDKIPEVHFIIGGDGEEKSRLHALKEELGLDGKVHFIGYVDNGDEFINILDINTLTSYSESFPYVLLEGARLKKPTVSSDVGGISCLIKEGETGYLFKAGDEKEFAAKVIKLLQEDELLTSYGEALYEYTKKNYSLERMGQDHVNIYRQMLAKN